MAETIKEIIERITEKYSVPLRLSSRCEANVYYRVEDLGAEDIRVCSEYIAQRIVSVCSPTLPTILVEMPGSFTGLAQTLAEELSPPGETLEVMSLEQVDAGNGHGSRLKNANIVLVNDVITTARSCIEAHTRITLRGASILCWAALIDRTFGPGPVPVVASFTGEPVKLLEEP